MAIIAISFSCGTPAAIKPGKARLKNVSVWSATCAMGRCQRLPLHNHTVIVKASCANPATLIANASHAVA